MYVWSDLHFHCCASNNGMLTSALHCLTHNNGKWWHQHAIVWRTTMESADVITFHCLTHNNGKCRRHHFPLCVSPHRLKENDVLDPESGSAILIITKIEWNGPWVAGYLPFIFRSNPSITFWVILLTDKQTDRQTDEKRSESATTFRNFKFKREDDDVMSNRFCQTASLTLTTTCQGQRSRTQSI